MKKFLLSKSTVFSIIFGTVLGGIILLSFFLLRRPLKQMPSPSELAQQYEKNLPAAEIFIASTSALSATSAATTVQGPKVQLPLSSAELEKSFGPCVDVPTLMYHHIQDLQVAKAAHQEKLTVGTNFFSEYMDYLRDHHYSVIAMQDLVDFFDHGKALPPKPILLTFDDGYADFATDAWPLLQSHGFKATMFLPTGLLEKSGYLQWSTIADIEKENLVLMANHTYSHHTMRSSLSIITTEITLSEKDLKAHHLDEPQIFAYPYGENSDQSEQFLKQQDYKLGFTTKHGRYLCKGQRIILPRIRVGNAPLSMYGL